MDRLKNYRIRLESGENALTLAPYAVCRIIDGGVSGLDYPKTLVRVSTDAFYDGGSITARSILSREITLCFEVTDRERFVEVRDLILKLMSPERDVRITTYMYGRRRFITATPAEGPEFIFDNFGNIPRVKLKFVSADPFFRDGAERRLTLPLQTPLFTFPFNITDGAGYTFSYSASGDKHVIYNPGDAVCGFRLTLKGVRGDVTEPYISVGERSLRFLEKVNMGDKLVFDTCRETKGVSLNGKIKYSFGKGDEFFGLEPGENLLTVSAVDGAENFSCELSFMPVYLGA